MVSTTRQRDFLDRLEQLCKEFEQEGVKFSYPQGLGRGCVAIEIYLSFVCVSA